MNHLRRLMLGLGALLAPAALAQSDVPDRFTPGEVALPDGSTYAYRLLAPPRETDAPEAGWPLVVFLHGAGERGSDNAAQLKYLPEQMAADAYRDRFPCYLLAVQCPEDGRWSDANWRSELPDPRAVQPEPPMQAVIATVEQLVAAQPIDLTRIYLTGLSMGGFGSWDLAARKPDWFAAVGPICGGGSTTGAEVYKGLPIWAWHDKDDGVVPVERTRQMVEAARKAGAEVTYTETTGFGHASWTPAYEIDNLPAWMFTQRRAQAAPSLAALRKTAGNASPKPRNPLRMHRGLESLRAAAAGRESVRIAFFGDSITWLNGFAGLIGDALREEGGPAEVVITNRGINGGGVRELRDGSPNASHEGGTPGGESNSPQAPFAQVLAEDRPDVVVIFIGINDVNWRGTSEQEFEGALRDIVASCGDGAVVLVTPWLNGERPDGGNERDAKVDRYAAIVRTVAAETGAGLADSRAESMRYLGTFNPARGPGGEPGHHGFLTYDGIHPSADGNTFLADLIGARIAEALEK